MQSVSQKSGSIGSGIELRQLTRFGYVTRAAAYKGYRKGCGRDQRVRQVWGAQAYKGVHKAGM